MVMVLPFLKITHEYPVYSKSGPTDFRRDSDALPLAKIID